MAATLAKVKLNNGPVEAQATQADKNVSLELGSGKYVFTYPADELKLATAVLK